MSFRLFPVEDYHVNVFRLPIEEANATLGWALNWGMNYSECVAALTGEADSGWWCYGSSAQQIFVLNICNHFFLMENVDVVYN